MDGGFWAWNARSFCHLQAMDFSSFSIRTTSDSSSFWSKKVAKDDADRNEEGNSEDNETRSGAAEGGGTEASGGAATNGETPARPLAAVMFNNEQVADQQIEEELHDSYLTYAMSTIMDRALPDVRDGLKPSQRPNAGGHERPYAGPARKHRKCAKIVGDTTGNYHPHGDQSVYPTLVRLAQHWNMRYTLVDPQGNFGSIDGDPPAAMRYTEARMTAEAVEMLEDLSSTPSTSSPTTTSTRDEPTVLPGKFPNLLVNGSRASPWAWPRAPAAQPAARCARRDPLIDHPECDRQRPDARSSRGRTFPPAG